MALKFKNRAKEQNLKKVLVYGMDGSGKSTFAEQYCKEHNLKPVCIDIDDTNYTNVPIVEINLTTDLTTYNSIKETIKDITKTKEFDTIILDGVTSLLELLTSKAKGMAAYSDRSKRWNDILRALLISRKNIIFVGQIDMELIFTPDAQSSKAVIKVNSMVNEKYYCYIDEKGQYLHDVKKFRTLEQIEAEASMPKSEPVREDYPIREVAAQEAHLAQRKSKPSGFETAATIDPTDENPVIENYVRTIAKRVALQGNKISKRTMRAKCFELVQMGDIPTELKDEIYLYINENCPGEK